jgi:tetratricopeptide (TPR) repeat protein
VEAANVDEPVALLKVIVRASLAALSGAAGSDLGLMVLPRLAQDVWKGWGLHRTEAERRSALRELATLSSSAVRPVLAQAIEEAAGDQVPEVRARVASFVKLVPRALHLSALRWDETGGLTIPSHLPLRRPEDLLPLLPPRLPRFKPGDRPLGGVDRELVKLLGVGEFGEVWRARNPDRPTLPHVALEFCLDPAAREQLLLQESVLQARILSQEEYPGIVPLRQVYLSADSPCLEYEFVEGGDLAGTVSGHQTAQGPLTVEAVTKLILQLARSLGHVHTLPAPLVHRNLEPSNVLVRNRSDKVEFLITRLEVGGVAASRALELTRAGGVGLRRALVTRGAHALLYASPEQVRGEFPDPRDDVHALGVLWYQLLIGAFTEGPPVGGMWRKELGQRGVSEKLLDLLEACIEPRAAHRPVHAAAVADQLQAILREQREQRRQQKEEQEQQELAGLRQEGQIRLTKLVRTCLEGSQGVFGEQDTQAIDELGRHYRLEPDQVDAAVVPLREQWYTDHPPAPPEPGGADTPDHLALATTALALGDPQGAIAACNLALKVDPPPRQANRLRARAYAGRNRLADAVQDLTTVLDSPEAATEDFVERGRLLVQLGRFDEALEDLTRALAGDPQSFPAYTARARAHVARGCWESAFADFDAALQIDPQASEVLADRAEAHLAQQSLEQALADFTEAIRCAPGNARSQLGRGRVLLALGEPEQALADLTSATQDDRTAGAAYLERGIAQARLGQDGPAIRDFTDALRRDKLLAQVYPHRARAHARLHQYGRAEADFDRALRVAPNDALLHVERGEVRAARGNLPAALEDYTRALWLDKNLARAHFGRGCAHLRAGWLTSALSNFTRALELEPEDPAIHAFRGLAYARKGQFDEALADAEECFRRKSHLAVAHHVRGLVLAGRNAPEQALMDLSQAIRLDPRSAGAALADRGLLCQAGGDYDRAIADFQVAIRLEPKEPSHYLQRARAYEELGDAEKARADRARAADLMSSRSKEEKRSQEQPRQ